MKIHLLAVGKRMPSWVQTGYQEYAQRMPIECSLQLTEIPAIKRTPSSHLPTILEQEGKSLLAAVPKGSRIIALDEQGENWSTPQLAQQMTSWHESTRNVSLLIGGPEGLSSACKQSADDCWALSNLTFPHPMVRIIVAEALYRAWSLRIGHPYHRG